MVCCLQDVIEYLKSHPDFFQKATTTGLIMTPAAVAKDREANANPFTDHGVYPSAPFLRSLAFCATHLPTCRLVPCKSWQCYGCFASLLIGSVFCCGGPPYSFWLLCPVCYECPVSLVQ